MKHIKNFKTIAEAANLTMTSPALKLVVDKMQAADLGEGVEIKIDANGDFILPEPSPAVELVDLGLSVKWAKYNLGATSGDTPESWYGDYYAWGETETKSDYSATTYTYREMPETLPSEHDVVAVKQGLRMPTKEELEELYRLQDKWVTDYNGIAGLNGRVFSGNGNELFIPAAGGFWQGEDGSYGEDGWAGYLWTSSLDTDNPSLASYFVAFSYTTGIDNWPRHYGFSVRGVSE